jgi:hypothetical protein
MMPADQEPLKLFRTVAHNRLSVIVLIVVGVVRPLRLVLGLAAG